MTTTRMLNLASLNDLNNYRGVSATTRTAVIGAIGFDIEGLTKQEGGNYTQEELIQGLRYLLSNNEKLRRYMITTTTYCDHSDPFFVPNGTDWMLMSLMLNSNMNAGHHYHHSDCSCCAATCSSDMDANSGGAILAVIALLSACVCCIGACCANYYMLNNDEVWSAKMIKLLANLACFLLPTAIAFYGFMQVFDPNDSYYYLYVSGAAFLVGASVALIVSLLNLIPCVKKEIALEIEIEERQIQQPPSAQLLAELDTVKRMLEGEYAKPEDNQEACKAFIKDVVRYYIQTIAKPENAIANEKTPILSRSRATLYGQQPYEPLPSLPPTTGKLAINMS